MQRKELSRPGTRGTVSPTIRKKSAHRDASAFPRGRGHSPPGVDEGMWTMAAQRCPIRHAGATLVAALILMPQLSPAGSPWRPLAAGMDLGQFPADASGKTADSQITILRMDPKLWDLDVLGAHQSAESGGLTAREWSRKHKLVAAINAGMFARDHRTHVGYLQVRDQVNNRQANDYQSVAAFHPRRPDLPPFRLFDLDAPGASLEGILRDYSSAVQNLRLIKRPRDNRWSEQAKKWSEAALGEDSDGRILFIFCRAALSMRALNQRLLSLDVGLACAQHLEGGPPAQLFLHAGSTDLELLGSYETSVREDDDNVKSWRLPFVLGVRQRPAPARRPEGAPVAPRALP